MGIMRPVLIPVAIVWMLVTIFQGFWSPVLYIFVIFPIILLIYALLAQGNKPAEGSGAEGRKPG
jgi:hypothetical protein